MDETRIIAWDRELRAAHAKLRAALELARESIEAETHGPPDTGSDLMLFCIGFCSALDGHHRSEDAALFPQLRAQRPELGDAIDKLMQDHSMLSYLLASLRAAVEAGEDRDSLSRHLDGISAIMESHFAYEEREILAPLAALRSDTSTTAMLGPL